MPRLARQRSETGIYHIMQRCINKQPVIKDNEDKERLLETLIRFKQVCNFELFGYCFMDNHIHLLLKEVVEPISLIIKRICNSYVYWVNWKYERCGPLFQDRFKSEAVENDRYFLTVIRYIHQNPVKAGIVKSVSEYRWSSFLEYIKEPVVADVDFALNMFSSDRDSAIALFQTFTNEQNSDQCLDYDDRLRVPDNMIKAMLEQHNISDINHLLQLNIKKRNEILKTLKKVEGVTIRQLSRLTGLSKSVIARI